MRRLFWLGLGIGLGAVSAAMGMRWTRRQVQRPAPREVGREAKGGLLDLSKLLAESMQEGRDAMAAREAELRARRRAPGAR